MIEIFGQAERRITRPLAVRECCTSVRSQDQASRPALGLGGLASEILLPLADLARRALHLGFEHVVGEAAEEFQGGGHRSDPRWATVH